MNVIILESKLKKEKNGDSEYTKYDNYSIYYFDIDSLTLYYMHSNI